MQRLSFATLLIALFAACPLLAQETRGSLTGRITDQTGAVMPNVNVEVVHAQTGVSSKTTTNQEGLYHVLYLVQGTYTVTASLSGFKTLVRQGIEIRINDRVELNLSMDLGAAAERVQVVGENSPAGNRHRVDGTGGRSPPHRRTASAPRQSNGRFGTDSRTRTGPHIRPGTLGWPCLRQRVDDVVSNRRLRIEQTRSNARRRRKYD